MLYSAYYVSCSAPATLGLAEPLNYGLSMPPGLLRREWRMLSYYVAADSAAAAVRGQLGCVLIVDRFISFTTHSLSAPPSVSVY